MARSDKWNTFWRRSRDVAALAPQANSQYLASYTSSTYPDQESDHSTCVRDCCGAPALVWDSVEPRLGRWPPKLEARIESPDVLKHRIGRTTIPRKSCLEKHAGHCRYYEGLDDLEERDQGLCCFYVRGVISIPVHSLETRVFLPLVPIFPFLSQSSNLIESQVNFSSVPVIPNFIRVEIFSSWRYSGTSHNSYGVSPLKPMMASISTLLSCMRMKITR